MANEALKNNSDWVRSALGMKNIALSLKDKQARTSDGVRFRFEDTRFGGGKAINQPAAYTEFADLPLGGILTRNDYGGANPEWLSVLGDYAQESGVGVVDREGVGATYASTYMDTGEYVTLRFGLAKQNSLLSFLTSFYNSEASAYARTGEAPSAFLKVTGVIGTVIGMALSPAFTVMKTVAFLVNKPISRFYYVDEKMHLFWSAANMILNAILVNNGTIPRINGRNQDETDLENQWKNVQNYYALMPDFFMSNGGVDLRIVATRHNRLALRFQEGIEEAILKSSKEESGVGTLKRIALSLTPNALMGSVLDPGGSSVSGYVQRYMEASLNNIDNLSADELENSVLKFANPPQEDEYGNVISASGESTPTEVMDDEGNVIGFQDTRTFTDTMNPDWEEYDSRLEKWTFGKKFKDLLFDRYNEGSDFITWRVENTGATNESFSTSTGEAAIASAFNSMSGGARELRFNAGNFQTGIGVIDTIASGIGSILGTGLDMVKFEGIKALLGNAFVDVPHIITGSAAQMPSMSYTMEFIPWSGDPITRIFELHAPLALALAMILPISSGKHSYNLPLLCEAYSRSRITAKVAAVTSMSISRGTTNLARNSDGDPLGVTVSWTLTDLSQIVHMPVTTDTGAFSKLAQFAGKAIDTGIQAVTGGNSRYAQAGATMLSESTVYDDSNKWTEYMAVLGGLTLQEQIYAGQKLRISTTNAMVNFDQWMSAPTFVNYLTTNKVTSIFFGRQWGLFARGTAATN